MRAPPGPVPLFPKETVTSFLFTARGAGGKVARMTDRFSSRRAVGTIGLLMIVVLAAVATVKDAVAPEAASVRAPHAAVAAVIVATNVAGFGLFAFVFWRLTTRSAPRSDRRTVLALVGQLVLALVVHTDLLILLAAELPLALTRRVARTWLAIQLAATTVYCVALWGRPSFEVVSGLERAPYALAFSLTTLSVVAWQTVAFAIGMLAATERAARREAETVSRELLATRSALEANAHSAERLRLARELHDTLGHHLTVLNVQLELAANRTDGAARVAVTDAQRISRLLLADVRETVGELRRDNASDLLDALRGMVQLIETPRVTLDIPEDLAIADPLRAHALLRAAQEGLTNALRHAEARVIEVGLAQSDDSLVLRVDDDGAAPREIARGHGLAGVEERVRPLGGTVAIETSPRGGWRLEVRIPREEAGP